MQLDFDYKLIRSKRRTISISVDRHGNVLVRAPLRSLTGDIERFLLQKTDWVKKTQKRVISERASLDNVRNLAGDEIDYLYDLAKRIIPERVAHYAPLVGVTYGRITIRKQKSRWGSCSNKGNLNFNCLLMLAPMEVVDSIVVHELCHRKEMNHSRRFYDHIYRVYPDYDTWHKWLKTHERELMKMGGD